MSALFGLALKSPLIWVSALCLALGIALTVRGHQLENTREDLATTEQQLEDEKAEHGRARGELAAALAANVNWQMAEDRRRTEAAHWAVEQARIQAQLKQQLSAARAEALDADRTLQKFVAQFNAAPESCRLATVQMEAACASLANY